MLFVLACLVILIDESADTKGLTDDVILPAFFLFFSSLISRDRTRGPGCQDKIIHGFQAPPREILKTVLLKQHNPSHEK